MQWDKYTIDTTTQAEDIISCTLADLGIEGVEIEDKVPLSESDVSKMFIDFIPDLGEDDGKSSVSFYLDSACDNSEKLKEVEAALDELRSFIDIGAGTITKSVTEDKDWINNWKEFFHAFTIDNILIKPTWEELPEDNEDKIVIEIDPGISFGTGKHETTQLCIRALSRYIKKDDFVLDVGCGSGILSIVSLKLGAGHVTGTDIDEDCIISTNDNFAVNKLDGSLGDFYVGDLTGDKYIQSIACTEKYDIVVANILADVIIPMAPVIPSCLKSGGIFISSGIIDFKEEEVCRAIEDAGMEIVERGHEGEWVSITALKI